MAGTGISSHELNMPGCYKDVTDTSIVAQFLVDKSSTSLFSEIEGEIFILAWTTTPWTLPSNTALTVPRRSVRARSWRTVGAKIEYVLVETENVYTQKKSKVVLAKALVEKQL
jgi:isoleucyl-tRNA synthetase